MEYTYLHDNVPTQKDLIGTGYPSGSTYRRYFGSFNAALEYAGLPYRKYTRLNDRPDICEICGLTETTQWCDKDGLKVCSNCKTCERKYLRGIVNPNSNVGIAIITEYIVSEILQDCVKCNVLGSFNSPYDLISDKYGTINVKSSILSDQNMWRFSNYTNTKIPDYYFCIGFDRFRFNILNVFIIPGNANVVFDSGIFIANSTFGLKRFKQYETNIKPYVDLYQNLNLTDLTEFRNFNKQKYIPPTKLSDVWKNS